MDHYDVAIIGGGIAGLSAAAEFAVEASVVVIEAEYQPSYHATGRSAAILAQNYGDSLIRALTRWSEPVLAGADRRLLRSRGLVRVATAERRSALERLFEDMARETSLIWMERSEVEARIPLLRPGWANCGFANEAAADIDVAGLVRDCLRRLKAYGGVVLPRSEVIGIARRDRMWHLTIAGDRQVTCRTVVNAAGAWADAVARRAGAAPLGLVPMRRTAVTFDAPANTDIAALPMTVDADEKFYLKPEGAGLMASPCDETPVAPGDSRPEELDVAICLDRIGYAFDLKICRPRATWSGLRTFAPDRRPVCGWDAGAPGFYWLAGQGGSGVQTAPALARIATDDVLGRDATRRTNIPGLDASALDPGRFGRRAAAQG